MDTQQLHKRLFDETYAALSYLNERHPPILISFSGVPGSGKTAIAHRLTEDLHANYIQLDDMRLTAHNLGFENVDVQAISKKLIAYVVRHCPNKLFILDASVDRRWPEFLDQCNSLSATPIIIRVTISAKDAEQNMQNRGRRDDPQLLSRIEKHMADFERCKQQLTADIDVTFPFDYKNILDLIKIRLSELYKK